MEPSDERVAAFLRRLREALTTERVGVSSYALGGAVEDLEWDSIDILLQLEELDVGDFHRCEASRHWEGGTVWVFCPEYDDSRLWIRLIERRGFFVISFHRG